MRENKECSNGAYTQPQGHAVALIRTKCQTMLIKKAKLYIAGVVHSRKNDTVDYDYGYEQPACGAERSYYVLLTISQLSYIVKACVLYLLEIDCRNCRTRSVANLACTCVAISPKYRQRGSKKKIPNVPAILEKNG
jgi:hypothetical protein